MSERKGSKVKETWEYGYDEEIHPRGETQLKVDMHVTNLVSKDAAWPQEELEEQARGQA